MINMEQSGKSLISLEELSKGEILELLRHASEFEKEPNRNILDGKVVST